MTAPLDLPDPVRLTTGDLLLRPWEPGDAAAVLAACNDPQVQRWTQVPVPYTADHARSYVEGGSQRWRTGEELGLAVVDTGSGELLASVCLRPATVPGTWDVGCWAAPGARGRGVVPQAVAALTRWGVEALGALRVEWKSDAHNWSSRRAAQKAGFTGEGVHRAAMAHRGQRCGEWVAARLPGDPDGDTAVLPRPGVLTAGDLVLRTWRPDDAVALEQALGEGLYVAGLQGRHAEPVSETALWWVQEHAPEREAAGAGVALGVWAGDRVVGSVQLFLAGRRTGLCEIGIWTAPPERGRGVATAAVRAALGWAQPALGLVRCEWLAARDNPASVALAERLGFVREGVARSALPSEAGHQDAVVLARTWPA